MLLPGGNLVALGAVSADVGLGRSVAGDTAIQGATILALNLH